MAKNQHIVPRNDGWAVRGEHNQRDTVHTRTQADAVKIGREIAKNQQSELLIHGKNGQIRARDSYGNDDCPPRG